MPDWRGDCAAGADEVSAGIAHLFSQHAQGYQALAGQAAAFQDQFVQHLKAGASWYASIEATIVSWLLGADGTNWLVSVFGPGFRETNLIQFISGMDCSSSCCLLTSCCPSSAYWRQPDEATERAAQSQFLAAVRTLRRCPTPGD